MDGRSRIASIGVGALALVAGLWLVLRDPRGAPAVPADLGDARIDPEGTNAGLRAPDEPSAARETLEVADDAAPAKVEGGAPAGPRVRSSSGLALPFIDWRGKVGDWRRVALAENGQALERPQAPCEVRAPGHLSAALGPADTELTLEPDALFTLRAPELRRCTRSIDVEDPYLPDSQRGSAEDRRRPEVAVWGFLSDSEWAVAFSAEAVLRELSQPELRVEVRLRDARRVDAVVRASPGSRWIWDVPCPDSVACAPLEVTVERLADEPRRTVRIQVGRYGLGYRDVVSENQPWGQVHLYPVGSWGESRDLAADVAEIEFDLVPLGLPLGLVAQDPSTKAYGRTLFVHDGTARRVALAPPLRVSGRLLDERDGTPLERAGLSWECRVDGKAAFGWRAEALDAELDPDGSFALVGPMNPPGNPTTPLDPPGRLWLRIEAPGFDPLELERELVGARELDVGELRLVPSAPALVLAPGHGLTPQAVTWHGFEIAGQPGRSWVVRWGRLADDGSLELHLVDEVRDGTIEGPDWSAARALILYVRDDAIPVRAFERDPEGRYAAVELRRYALEFRVEPSASDRNWRIGWEWNGLFAVCEGFSRPPAGEAIRMQISAPAAGARLAWVGREAGQTGRSKPTELVPLSDGMPVQILR